MAIFNKKQFIKNPNDYNYHLKINDNDIGEIVFLVGDPGRVPEISKYFEKIYSKNNNREFVTHCGFFNKNKVSVISTGIGIDNIEIVMNEINSIIQKKRKIKFIRIGTSGSIKKHIKIGSLVVSKHCLGIDSLIYYYNNYQKFINKRESDNLINHCLFDANMAKPYIVDCSENLFQKFQELQHGITWTTIGFYAPQFRQNSLINNNLKIFDSITNFEIQNCQIINFEMESSVLYFLAKLFGHEAITICAILANRANNTYHENPEKAINDLIKKVLDKI